jgi:hypothetical protein
MPGDHEAQGLEMTVRHIIRDAVGILGALLIVINGPQLLMDWMEHYRATGWPQLDLHEGAGFLAGCFICACAVRMVPR